MSEMALRLIRQAKLEGWSRLDLGNCEILGSIPWQIKDLTALKELTFDDSWYWRDFGWNKYYSVNRGRKNIIKCLPDRLPPNIERFSISDNFVEDISPLAQLRNLEQLSIRSNPVTNISALSYLGRLNALDIHATEVRSLHSIRNLKSLVFLDIGNTSVTSLDPISNFVSLEELYATNTEIDSLWGIRNLLDLKILDISGTLIEKVDCLEKLNRLEVINLSRTQVSDISGLESLCWPRWKVLSEGGRYFVRKRDRSDEIKINTDYPRTRKAIKISSSLKRIDIKGTGVKDLSPLAALFVNGLEVYGAYDTLKSGIFVDLDRIENPPASILVHGAFAVYSFFEELLRVGTLPATDIKLFLLGNTNAGKSTLRHALIHEKYDEKITSTHGADLQEAWKDGEETLHLWDFGGQEYFHATHRLFLNRNSLYAVIADPNFNKGGFHKILIKHFSESEPRDEDLEHFHHDYWLEMVQRAAPQGSVMVIWNKMDQTEMPRHGLTDAEKLRFPAPSEVREYEQSPKAAIQENNPRWKAQFEILRHDVLEAAREQLKDQKVIKYWPQVREAMEQRSKTDLWISWEEFVRICMDDDPLRELGNIIIYLRDMCGAILYWDVPGLRDQVFINPNKINQLIYAVLDRTVQQAQGRFTRAHAEVQVAKALTQLHGADAQARDIPATTETLLRVMRQFEIIFEVAEGTGEYVAPQYLNREEPETVKVAKEHVRYLPAFTLRFKSYIPRHNIPRFIVSKGLLSKRGHYWKMGIIFRENEVSACVEVDYERNEISVEMQDAAAHPAQQRVILDSLRKLADMDDALELAPAGKALVALSALIDGLHSGASRVRDCEGNWADIAPYSYLITARSGHSSSHLPPDHQRDSMKRIYISYASSDKDKVYLAELNECLKLQKKRGRFDGWDRGQMNPGDIKLNRMTAELAKADIFMPLISSSYFADEGEATWELDEAMKLADAGKLQIVPVVVRAVFGWQDLPIGKYTPALEAKPIGQMPDKDDAWQEVMAWIDRSLQVERSSAITAPNPSLGDQNVNLTEEIRELKQMIAELQSQNQSGHLETQRLLQDSSALLINKLSGVKEFQGTVFEYLRAMEDRLQRGADLKHDELQILLSCIEDGLTLVMEEMDESQKEQLRALSPKSSGGGLLDILKLKVALIPMALAILSGDYEKAAELLSEAVLLDATVSNGKKMLVEAWGRAQRLLSTTG